jgi:hypothetical protein
LKKKIQRHAKNSAGQFGAIPENYVQPIDDTSDATSASVPNTHSNYPDFDAFNPNEHDTRKLSETSYQPPVEQNQYLNSNLCDDWSLSEPVIPSQLTVRYFLLLFSFIKNESPMLLY